MPLTKFYIVVRDSGSVVHFYSDLSVAHREARAYNKAPSLAKHAPYRILECVKAPEDGGKPLDQRYAPYIPMKTILV
jgi:hypothetical protein